MVIFLAVYGVICLLFSTILLANAIYAFDWKDMKYTPNTYFENTYLNYPTCIILFILSLFFAPLYWIWIFFYWLTHVGR